MKRFVLFALLGLLASPATAVGFDALKLLKKKKSKKTSGQPTEVAGVRGLEKPEGNDDPGARDYVSVEKLERLRMSDKKIAVFIKEGRLRKIP